MTIHQERTQAPSTQPGSEVTPRGPHNPNRRRNLALGIGGAAAGIITTGLVFGLANSGDSEADPSVQPSTPVEQPSVTPSVMESEQPSESVDYGPSGAERDEFIKSLEMSADMTDEELGKQLVFILNTWRNIGATQEIVEGYNENYLGPDGEVVRAADYAELYVSDFIDEFETVLDQTSPSYGPLRDQLVDLSTEGAYLHLVTVDNPSANVVYSSDWTFVSASSETPTDTSKRGLEVIMHIQDNFVDTGLAPDGQINADVDATLHVGFTQKDDGKLTIATLDFRR